MFKRFFVILALLTGCRTKPVPPTAPGTSEALKYPVVLIGQGRLDVRDDQPALVSATTASGMNFFERTIADSSGAIYEIKNDTVIDGTAWWRDLGTSQQTHYLELKKTSRPSLDRIKRLVLDQLNPRGDRDVKPDAVARINGFANVKDLIEDCRNYREWTH